MRKGTLPLHKMDKRTNFLAMPLAVSWKRTPVDIRHLTQPPLHSQQILTLIGHGNLHLITQHFPNMLLFPLTVQ